MIAERNVGEAWHTLTYMHPSNQIIPLQVPFQPTEVRSDLLFTAIRRFSGDVKVIWEVSDRTPAANVSFNI